MPVTDKEIDDIIEKIIGGKVAPAIVMKFFIKVSKAPEDQHNFLLKLAANPEVIRILNENDLGDLAESALAEKQAAENHQGSIATNEAPPQQLNKPADVSAHQSLSQQMFTEEEKEVNNLLNAIKERGLNADNSDYFARLKEISINAMNNNPELMIHIKNQLILAENLAIKNAYHKFVIQSFPEKLPKEGPTLIVEKPVRYLHSKINIDYINSTNNKVFSDEEISSIEAKMQGKQQMEYKGQSIIKVSENGKESLYAINAQIGQGSIASVSLAQNLTSDEGEWVAVKAMSNLKLEEEQKRGYQIYNEVGALIASGIYRGHVVINNTENKPGQTMIVLNLAEGVELLNAVESEASFLKLINDSVWLNIGSSLLTGYDNQIAKSGYFNCDLKLNNVLINLATGELTFVDMSDSKKIVNGVATAMFSGTPGFIAPEVLKQLTPGNNMVTYTEKSEVFALGTMLRLIYQFSYMKDGVEYSNQFNKFSEALKRFPNENLRKMMDDFLLQMTNEDPNKRPTLNQCKAFFDTFKHLTLLATEIKKNVAIVDINEFRLLQGTTAKTALIDELKKADEVWLLDSAAPKQEYEYLKIVAELQKKGVRMGKKLFAHPDTEALSSGANRSDALYTQMQLISGIKQEVERQRPDDLMNYSYVSVMKRNSAFTNDLKNERITHVAPGVTHSEPQCLNNHQYQVVINALNEDITKLRERYQDKTPPILERIKDLENFKNQLAVAMRDEETFLPIEVVMKKLDALQQKMYAPTVIESILPSLGGDVMAKDLEKSAEQIKNIKETLQSRQGPAAHS